MDRSIESGSGIISSLQGIGSSSFRRLSPKKVTFWSLMQYCAKPVKFVPLGSESEYTYQTLCEDLELFMSFEVVLLKNAYKTRVNVEVGQPGSQNYSSNL